MDVHKLHENFLKAPTGGYIDSGKLADVGLPEINDSLTNNRIELLKRPIVSLENIGSLQLNNIILEVFFFLDRIVTYFCGLFEFDDYSEESPSASSLDKANGMIQPNITPNKPCKQFNRIKQIFIKNGYFGELYMAYGQGYVNAELRALRLGKKNQKTSLEEPDIYPNCKWRLYTIKRDDRGDVTFTSLISGIEGHKFDPKKMVKCSYGGMGLFLDGFDLAKEGVSMNKMYVYLAKVATTRIKVEISKPADWAKEKEDIHGGKTYYAQKDSGNTNSIDPEVFITPEELKEYMHANMLYISQRMNTLGMVINPTNKAERMTTGEHYKDLKFSSCTESQLLSNLAGICEDMNKNFDTKLDVYLTSSLQANGAPKTTQNPYEQFKTQGGGGFDGSFGGEISNQFTK